MGIRASRFEPRERVELQVCRGNLEYFLANALVCVLGVELACFDVAERDGLTRVVWEYDIGNREAKRAMKTWRHVVFDHVSAEVWESTV